MLEAIGGYLAGFLSDKLMNKNIKPWLISMIINGVALLLCVLYQAFFSEQSLIDFFIPIWFPVLIFGSSYLFVLVVVVYFYKRETIQSKE